MQQQRGQDSSVPAFSALLLLSLVFAYLEFRAFGHDVPMPMYGYLLAAVVALANLLVSRFSEDLQHLQLRLVSNGLLVMGTAIGAVFLQKYSAYHAIEFVLLLVWLGSLGRLGVRLTLPLNLLLAIAFIAVMYLTGISGFWISLVSLLLGSAVLLGGFLGYASERILATQKLSVAVPQLPQVALNRRLRQIRMMQMCAPRHSSIGQRIPSR